MAEEDEMSRLTRIVEEEKRKLKKGILRVDGQKEVDDSDFLDEFLPAEDISVPVPVPKKEIPIFMKTDLGKRRKKKKGKTLDVLSGTKEEEPVKLSFFKSWILSLIAVIIIIAVFTVTELYDDPIIAPIEILLVIVAFSLTGVLTRSKKQSILTIVPTAIIMYFIFYFADLRYPFGLFGNLLGENGVIQSNMETLETLPGVSLSELPLELIGWILDISFLIIILPLAALMLIVLYNRFTLEEKGKFGSVLIAIFYILLILSLPFAYIGIAKFSEGTTYIGLAVSESLESSGLDLENIDFADLLNNETTLEILIDSLSLAKENIDKAIFNFDFVESNIFILSLLAILGYGDLINAFKGIDAFSDFIDGAPGILRGLYSLSYGLNLTLEAFPAYLEPDNTTVPASYLTTKTAAVSNNTEYSEDFGIGLSFLQMAVDNFTEAQTPLSSSLLELEIALSSKSLEKLVMPTSELLETVRGLENGLPYLLELGSLLIDICNSTYMAILAVNNISIEDFEAADMWMNLAQANIEELSSNLNFAEVNSSDTWQPIIHILHSFDGISQSLNHFIKGGVAGVNTFLTLNETISRLENVNSSLSPGEDEDNDILWDSTRIGISEGQAYFNNLTDEMMAANETITEYRSYDYGDLNETFTPIFDMISESVGEFQANTDDAGMLIYAIEGTFDSYYNLSLGSGLFLGFIASNPAPIYYPNNFTEANNRVLSANSSATNAYHNLTDCTIISNDSKVVWQEILYTDNNNSKDDIISLCGTVIQTITGIEFILPVDAIQTVITVLEDLENLNIDNVF